MHSVLFFNEIKKESISEVGGKGANLGEMTRAGFPVPEGFCLTTEVYCKFIEGFEFANKEPGQIREELQRLALPEECTQDLESALKRFPEGTLFSVRSSATAEDLAFASFAGQQDTYLNVPKDGVGQAVINCFASLFTDRAVSYRAQNGIRDAGMSVVVQKMVRSDSSGVMFTADPVTCRRNLLVIDAVYGLGEAIVSGQVLPDHYEYERDTGEIRIVSVPEKEFAILPLAGGGTEKKRIQRTDQVLQEEQIRKLAVLGELLEAHYGSPQDVEWGFEDGKLYVLQTRAITSLYPVPEFRDDCYHFVYNMGYQQMYTKAMPVLSIDMLGNAFNMGTREENLVFYNGLFIGGTNYLLADFSRILSIPPVRKIFLETLFPIMDPAVIPAFKELINRKRKLHLPDKVIFKMYRSLLPGFLHYIRSEDPEGEASNLVQYMEECRQQNLAAIDRADISHEGLRAIIDHVGIADFFFRRFIPALIGGGAFTLMRLKKLEKELGIEGKYTNDIQAGNEGNKGTEMNLLLGDLADLLNKDPQLKAKLEADSWEEEVLMTDHGAFSEAYDLFMKEYGFRATGEIDISRPRWKDDPSVLIGQILGMSVNKTPGSHRTDFESKKETAQRQMDAFVAEVAEKKGKDKAEKTRALLIRFRSYWALREHLKHFWMSNFGAAREALLRIADNFVERGILECRDDIFHLHLAEIDRALDTDDDLRLLVSSRQEDFDRLSRLPSPRIITSEGEVLQGGIKMDDLPENALAGSGVSAGRTEGIAKVISDPGDATIEKGEILVASFTDPGWTPLFVNAAAVVTEVGGMLTHGAVVAREYGIPGVVGVTDATKLIHSGQRIIVDGTGGFVEILSDETKINRDSK